MRIEQDSLIELLAEKEHESWSRWMQQLFLKCSILSDGSYVIPVAMVRRWQWQMNTPYAQLSEEEKQLDRNEIIHLLPILEQL